MRVVTSEFGRINPRKLNKRVLTQLKRLDQTYELAGRSVFDWSNPDWLKIQNYVGVIQVPGLTIEIPPKTASATEAIFDPDKSARADWAQPQRNLVVMLTIAGMLQPFERGYAGLEIARTPLLEALVSAFARSLIKELRRGLDRAYVERTENLAVLRGKLEVCTHVRINALHPERLFVTYDEFNPDTMLNRILRAACRRLLAATTLSQTQQLLRECLMDLADVEDLAITEDCFDRIHLSRNNVRFSSLLEFSRLVLLGFSPQLRAGEVTTLALLFQMEKVFERFVGNLIRRHAEELGFSREQVLLQGVGSSRWLLQTPSGSGRFALKPDIQILDRTGSVQAIVDTKWKLLRRDSDDRRNGVDQADVYQMFAYAMSFRSRDNILLYPRVEGVTPKEYYVSDHGLTRRIRVETVDLDCNLARSWPTVVKQLQRVFRLDQIEIPLPI